MIHGHLSIGPIGEEGSFRFLDLSYIAVAILWICHFLKRTYELYIHEMRFFLLILCWHYNIASVIYKWRFIPLVCNWQFRITGWRTKITEPVILAQGQLAGQLDQITSSFSPLGHYWHFEPLCDVDVGTGPKNIGKEKYFQAAEELPPG